MIRLIRTIFGLTRPRRSESAQPHSKRKTSQDSKLQKAPSLDSKKKLLQTQQKAKQEREALNEMDEVGTVKREIGGRSKAYPCINGQKMQGASVFGGDHSVIEDQDLLKSNMQQKLSAHSNQSFSHGQIASMKKQSAFTFGQNYPATHNVITYPDCMSNDPVISQVQPRDSVKFGKVLVKKQNNHRRRPIKVNNRCSFCKEPLQIQGSLKLACSHRFHEKCAQKMKQRNRYECDLCQVKRKNLCSIILLDRKRCRGYLPYNNR